MNCCCADWSSSFAHVAPVVLTVVSQSKNTVKRYIIEPAVLTLPYYGVKMWCIEIMCMHDVHSLVPMPGRGYLSHVM